MDFDRLNQWWINYNGLSKVLELPKYVDGNPLLILSLMSEFCLTWNPVSQERFIDISNINDDGGGILLF